MTECFGALTVDQKRAITHDLCCGGAIQLWPRPAKQNQDSRLTATYLALLPSSPTICCRRRGRLGGRGHIEPGSLGVHFSRITRFG